MGGFPLFPPQFPIDLKNTSQASVLGGKNTDRFSIMICISGQELPMMINISGKGYGDQ